jgi:hypothetical protein
MSRGTGLHRLTGGVAKREREQWERLADGWPCPLRVEGHKCGERGVALLFDWAGNAKPVCATHAPQAAKHGLKPVYPDAEPAQGLEQER